MFYIYHCLNLTHAKQRAVDTLLHKIKTRRYENFLTFKKRKDRVKRRHMKEIASPSLPSITSPCSPPTTWGPPFLPDLVSEQDPQFTLLLLLLKHTDVALASRPLHLPLTLLEMPPLHVLAQWPLSLNSQPCSNITVSEKSS